MTWPLSLFRSTEKSEINRDRFCSSKNWLRPRLVFIGYFFLAFMTSKCANIFISKLQQESQVNWIISEENDSGLCIFTAGENAIKRVFIVHDAAAN